MSRDTGASCRRSLVAAGRCERWAIDIDENIELPGEHFLQLEGPFVYIYIRMLRLSVLKEVAALLAGSSIPSVDGVVQLGQLDRSSVELRLDSDTQNGSLCLQSDGSFVQFSFSVDDLRKINSAMAEVIESLDAEGRFASSESHPLGATGGTPPVRYGQGVD